jgi:lysophospholipase L1-like esterase
MTSLPAPIFYWRPAGAANDAWMLETNGAFSPDPGAAVEVVSVGPSRPAFITADTAPALIAPIADRSVQTGLEMRVDVAAAFSGTNLVFSIVSGPAGATISGADLIWTPDAAQSVDITLRARNAAGQIEDVFTVSASADAAEAVAMTPMEASYGAALAATAATYLPAGGYSYALVSAPPEVADAAVDASTGRLTATMPGSGALSAPFVVRATGATLYDLSLAVTLTTGWSYGAIIAVGDSITSGGNGGVTSWVGDVAAQWGASSDNNGVGGTVLQGSLADGGVALAGNFMNGFVIRSITPTGDAIICAYGYNDARYILAEETFNAAAYLSDFRSILRRWLVRFGRENIWLATPHWISDVGLTTAVNPDFGGRTRAWFETYVAACRTVAAEFGVKLIDTYEIGYPSTTVDDIHPSAPAQAEIVAALAAPKRPTLALSTAVPVGGAEDLTVPVGVSAYVVAADAKTETALSEGSNALAAGDYAVAWSDGGRWELSTITVTAAAVTDPTVGMTLTANWSAGLAYSTLKPTITAMTAKFFVTRSAGEYGVLFEMGGTGYGGYAIIYDDAGTDRLMVLMGYPNGSYASNTDVAVITMPAPTGTFEVMISGDCITGQKAALYINDVLIGTDTVSATYLSGGRNGGIGQVWDQIPANPPGWSADGHGANAMVSSAEIYSGQATAEVMS